MKCQSQFSGENTKNIVGLSSAKLAQRAVVKVNENGYLLKRGNAFELFWLPSEKEKVYSKR